MRIKDGREEIISLKTPYTTKFDVGVRNVPAWLSHVLANSASKPTRLVYRVVTLHCHAREWGIRR